VPWCYLRDRSLIMEAPCRSRSCRWRHRHGNSMLALIAGALVAAIGAFHTSFPGAMAQPRQVLQTPQQLNADEDVNADMLRDLLERVELLQDQVDAGLVLSNFGQQADAIISRAKARPELERAVDGMLHALFLQQLATLQQTLLSKFTQNRYVTAGTITRADREFVARAQALLRPGSTWSFEPERTSLHASLTGCFHQDTLLAQEKTRAIQTQRATADVIGKLQQQMDHLGEKLRGLGGGSPWFLWTTYHIPGTPFQLSGRYQQGRTNIELNLDRDKDPARGEAGFIDGVLSKRLGLSLNVGV